ncbi:hypothetical protein Efla_004270 [Eimeria flavescens]
MKRLAWATLAAGALLVASIGVEGADFRDYDEEIVRVRAKHVDCLPTFNSARSVARFPPFRNAAESPYLETLEEAQAFIKMGCNSLLERKPADNASRFDATMAVVVQEGEVADCAAAVHSIRAAVPNFKGVPGPYKKGEEPYDSIDNVAVVALFNPKKDPQLDCFSLTCMEQELGGQVVVRGLVCATTPVALEENRAPFTEEEFARIVASIGEPLPPASGGASPPLVSLLSAAAAGILFVF